MEIVGAIIAAMVAGIFSMYTNQKTNQQSQKNQQAQNQWNEEQAQIAREWDKPEEQMERLLAAGINPAAAADSITGSSPIGSPVAQTGQGAPVFNPDLSFSNLTKQFKDIAEASKTKKDKDWIDRLNNKAIDKYDAEIKKDVSQRDLNDELKNYYETSATQMVRMNDQNIINLQSENNKTLASIELIQSQKINTDKATQVLDKDLELKESQINVNESVIEKNESDINRNESEVERNKTLNEVSKADIIEKLSQAGLNKAATILKQSETNLTNVETQKAVYEAIITDYKAQLAEKGMFVDSGFLNNLVTVPSKISNLREMYQPAIDFIQFLNNTGDKILNGINEVNESFKKGAKNNKNNKIGTNIYGKPWDSGRPVYNPDVR